MKIAVAGFQHETNRFSPIPTVLADFEKEDGWPGLTSGPALFEVFAPLNIPLSGFLQHAARQHHEIVPVLWASAEPGGLVADAAFEEITQRIAAHIEVALPLDGIYLDLHGAMVTESFQDGEGELLARLRARLGDDIPIAVSLDLHANLTSKMVEMADVLTIFRTYPHLDMAQTGQRAGILLDEILATKRKRSVAFRKPPLLIPLQSQCTDLEPCQSIYQAIRDENSLHDIHADIAMGFPPSDIADSGPGIVTYSFSQARASDKADQLEQLFWENETGFASSLYTEDEAVKLAIECYSGKGPILLADIQDNSGAGATSDTTGLLRALVKHRASRCVFAAVYDTKAVEQAHQAGCGGVFSCHLGGKFAGAGIAPYHGTFKVIALSDGRFPYHGEMMRGGVANIGPTAALQLIDEGVDICIVVTSERIQCLDQALISHLGIDLTAMAILAIKSTVHFRADFAPIVDRIILVDSPGFNPCQLTRELLPRLRPGVRIV